MKKIYFLIVPFLFICVPAFSYSQKQELQIKQAIGAKQNYKDQLLLIQKVKTTSQNDTHFLLKLKKEIILKNLKQILADSHNDYQNRKEIYYKYFQVLQSVDSKASINPYYFLELTQKIHESDIYLKSYIYIFYQIKEKLRSNRNYYNNYLENIKYSLQHSKENVVILDGETFQYLKSKGYNYLSKNDLLQLRNFIINNKVGTDSKMFHYYVKYKSFLENFSHNSIFLKNTFQQKLQEKNLSCELNSASLFASYLLGKNISEEDIFSYIPSYQTPIEKVGNYYIWGNPHQEFVGDINGKQTKIVDKMTGYGVYAKPISHALEQVGIKNKVTSFDTDTIIKSLLENEPIIFWYLSRNSAGGLNTTPVHWKTLDNKIISGYIGEHTGVIVGVSFFNNGEIDKVFFYEGRNQELQSFDYNIIKYQTSFLNMMITKD